MLREEQPSRSNRSYQKRAANVRMHHVAKEIVEHTRCWTLDRPVLYALSDPYGTWLAGDILPDLMLPMLGFLLNAALLGGDVQQPLVVARKESLPIESATPKMLIVHINQHLHVHITFVEQ